MVQVVPTRLTLVSCFDSPCDTENWHLQCGVEIVLATNVTLLKDPKVSLSFFDIVRAQMLRTSHI